MLSRSRRTFLMFAAGLIGSAAGFSAVARAADADAVPVSLTRPTWKVGDTWVVETLTERLQARTANDSSSPGRIRWQFHVAKLETLAGKECYRIDVECLTAGRIRPRTTIWCDTDTLFLRQFETQLAVNGKMRTIQESYDCAKGAFSPVIAPVNAIPLGLPAFVPEGAKGGNEFSYVSQPLPAGSKDTSVLRFAFSVKQDVSEPADQYMKRLPETYTKALDEKPVRQVKISTPEQNVVQLWKDGSPWPVYVNNGRTQAWLVSSGNTGGNN